MGGGSRSQRSAIVTGWERYEAISSQIYNEVGHYFNVPFFGLYEFGDTEDQEWLATLRPDFIFNFGPLIFEPVLLDACREGAINFHPAPPDYPGRGGATYAIYNDDDWYGITAHLMEPEIDSGAILDVFSIPVQPDIRPDQLNELALRYVPIFASAIIEKAAEDRLAPTTQYEWGGPAATQADLERFMMLTPTTDEYTFRRKIAALRHPEKPGPFLMWRGVKFWYIEGMS